MAAFVYRLPGASFSFSTNRPTTDIPKCSHASATANTSFDALCPEAVRSLRRYYTQQNSLPQSAGCAHELGRVAQMARDLSLTDLCGIVGGSPKRTSLHSSPVHAVIHVLDSLALVKHDEIVLYLYDDPSWTVPIQSHAETFGASVVWVADVTAEKLARAAGSRTRAVVLQLVSPLLGKFDNGNTDDALRFARAAGLPVVVDATDALGAVPFRAEQLPADCVVIGGGGIGAHPGAAVALWSHATWKKYDVASSQSCSQSDANTAALTSFTSSMKRVLDRTSSNSSDFEFRARTAQLTDTMCKELGALNTHIYTVVGGLDPRRAIPAVSLSVNTDALGPLEIARRLHAADADGATAARLRVLCAVKMGRGRKKVDRKQLINLQFSANIHSQDDMCRFLRRFNRVAEMQ